MRLEDEGNAPHFGATRRGCRIPVRLSRRGRIRSGLSLLAEALSSLRWCRATCRRSLSSWRACVFWLRWRVLVCWASCLSGHSGRTPTKHRRNGARTVLEGRPGFDDVSSAFGANVLSRCRASRQRRVDCSDHRQVGVIGPVDRGKRNTVVEGNKGALVPNRQRQQVEIGKLTRAMNPTRVYNGLIEDAYIIRPELV